MVICNSCGANMRFDPEEGVLKCDYCGSIINEEDNEKIIEAEKDKYYDAIVYKCPQCGAELLTTEETMATFCNYCGSSILVRDRVDKQKKPDCVVPFSISQNQCEILYKNKLKKAWFVPENIKKNFQIEKFRGIYMPYWIYDFEDRDEVVFTGSKSWRSGDYIYTQYYDIKAGIDGKYSGIPFDSSSKFYDNISQSMPNYNLKTAKDFDEKYLSGFYVDVGDVPASVYEDNARKIIGFDIKNKLKKLSSVKSYNPVFNNLENQFVTSNEKMGYLPVWFLATKTKDGKNVSYAAINGHTGKVTAELPIDINKFLIVSLAFAVLIFLIINRFITITPFVMLGLAGIFNTIGLLILNNNHNQIYRRDKLIDDEGASYNSNRKAEVEILTQNTKQNKTISLSWLLPIIALVSMLIGTLIIPFKYIGGYFLLWLIVSPSIVGANFKKDIHIEKKKRMPFMLKLPKLIMPMLGLLTIIGTLIVNPVDDENYYIAAIVSFVCLLLSIIQIIKSRNLLTMRKLPQLEKRGGDKDE